ncbi:MAG: succinate--CoA ligase subunit beta [Halothiobacillus sp. 14-56-357]|jgi:succinyl-CoA synthetase beta subunit|uniref:Succinate--CoA ligase [ADP-forming] subunit beta n=1 Tax=Halothiobacillus neapolitanus (strain ATCC 23641 / DSM 15147 / CIP 104769 / NCIMB 8539 / c2) TaxID=555778 RepID=D0KVI0_HALNC|nr:ADP-forming succinate--CoA ligase subunit beta [Halothiobacillus neapolitanus]ACX96810.1 succinyl-CoA synthetase, beta subunit [Halothiobacillus neapolitanus c2]OZB55162.1 MAG: succinate--CoA ligase subunit beta [Halothiobacillus sp. 14-56-357]TDN65081.1 succinyl-CoA synthetase beta subunit [Halothiobacillus neapolitanus]
MNLHEYQAKALLTGFSVPVATGLVINHPAQAADDQLPPSDDQRWVLKAQIHSGARGKAGGVLIADSPDDIRAKAAELLGKTLVTHQTGPTGLPVHQLLIEPASAITQELYLAMTIDRQRQRVVVIASQHGGMDIEQVSAEHPDAIFRLYINPTVGLMGYQARRLGFALGLSDTALKQFPALLRGVYDAFIKNDADLIEINPLAVTADNTLLAVDAKIAIDGNAAYRQKALFATRDVTQEDPTEVAAQASGLNYISLTGEIACMVNGAGLAMATMDLIQSAGGSPANFLDVGGGTSTEKVAAAFKLILANPRVKAILVNIFGGIVRCDLIANGIIAAAHEVGLTLPTVVRLEGTNAAEGRRLLAESGLNLIAENDLAAAAARVVALSNTDSANKDSANGADA